MLGQTVPCSQSTCAMKCFACNVSRHCVTMSLQHSRAGALARQERHRPPGAAESSRHKSIPRATPESITSNRQLPSGIWAGASSRHGNPAKAHDAVANELIHQQILRLARLVHHLALLAVQLHSTGARHRAMHFIGCSSACMQVWQWNACKACTFGCMSVRLRQAEAWTICFRHRRIP